MINRIKKEIESLYIICHKIKTEVLEEKLKHIIFLCELEEQRQFK